MTPNLLLAHGSSPQNIFKNYCTDNRTDNRALHAKSYLSNNIVPKYLNTEEQEKNMTQEE